MTFAGRIADAAFGRKQLIVLIACVAMAIGVIAGLSAKKAIWEGWFTDRLFQIRAIMVGAQPSASAPVAVIGLDQTALDSDRLSPYPRVLMTPVLAETGQAILDSGAVALGFDFVFAYSADSFVYPETGEESLRGFDLPFQRFLFANRGRVFIAHTEVGVPHRRFTAAAGSGGVRSVIISTDSDGVVRSHTPQLPLAQSPYLIDALLGAARSSMSETYTAIPDARLSSSIPYLSMIDVLTMMESEEGREKLKEFARGRIILIGSLIPFEDEHLYSDRFLPVAAADQVETGQSGRPRVQAQTAGVFILADLVGAALTGRVALEPPTGLLWGLAIAFAIAGAFAGLMLPLMTLPLVAIGGIAAALGISLAGLEFGFLIAPGVAPVACIVAMVVAASGKVAVLQRKQRSLVRLFSHYLAPDVIRQMAHSEQLPELGGDTRTVVVAFIDIAGFTKMSDSLADGEVVKMVNTCFDEIGRVITAHHGYIDKYIGDAIMAVWNAPNTVANPEQAAVDASREIVGLLDDLRRKTGQSILDLRVALNAGPVLVGDIGGEFRRSFTVMGTTVNTASRIESVAKDKKVRLAFSQSVAQNLASTYPVKEIWSGQLRGLSKDISVFTLDIAEMYMEDDFSTKDKSKQQQPKLLKFPR